jgi:hypothetical protein
MSGDSCAYGVGSPDSQYNSDMSEDGDNGEIVNGEYGASLCLVSGIASFITDSDTSQ